MSWFLGVWHEHGRGESSLLETSRVDHSHLELTHADSSETVHLSANSATGWIVCGNGIRYSDGMCSLVKVSDWNQVFSKSNAQLPSDGHYAALRWTETGFSLYTDATEYRRVYYFRQNGKIFFSTDLYRLVPYLDNRQFRFDALASQFSMINSYSDDALLKNVERLGQKGEMHFCDGLIKHSFTMWEPDRVVPKESAAEVLTAFTTLPFREGKTVSLGLSGGIDCRTLLAILLNEKPEQTSIFSLGVMGDPDFELAKEIAQELSLESRFYDLQSFCNQSAEVQFDEMKLYALQTEGAANLKHFFHTRVFSDVGSNGTWMMDGAEGEFLRQAFGNKVLRRKRKEMLRKDANALYPILTQRSGLGLSSEFSQEMEKASFEVFKRAVDIMPDTNSYTPEDWFNTFTLRYRVRNAPPNAQGLVDNCTVNHMPFAQPTLLSAVANTPLHKRHNSAIARSIIQKQYPKVNRVPYLRRGIRAPFWLLDYFYPMLGVSKIVKKIRPPRLPEPFVYSSLQSMRAILLDRVKCSAVQSCSWYDAASLKTLEETLTKGSLRVSTESAVVLEWLQFDFWREHLNLS